MGYVSIIYTKLILSLALFIHPVVYNLEFNTAYNQFYIGDKGNRGDTGASSFWTEQAYNDKLAIADGILGLGTGSYGHIKAELSLLDKPGVVKTFEKYDHVVEGSLMVRSGFIEVVDCPTNHVELQLKVKPGSYRVRVYSIDLAKADNDLYNGRD